MGVDPRNFYFSVALLDQLYWIAGSVIGGIAGGMLEGVISIEGIDFAMTALFVVIAVDQWKAYRKHLPVFLGLGCTLVCLVVIGAEQMLLPALGLIVLALLVLRSRLEDRAEEEEVDAP